MSAQTTPSSTKSWQTFEVELKPEQSARFLVLVSAWALLLLGSVLVVAVDLPVWARVLTIALWWVDLGFSVGRLFAAQGSVRRMRLGPQAAALLTLKGDATCTAIWGSGSVVTARWAWVRLCGGERVYSELFLKCAVEPDCWRRLQVVWRWGDRG